MMSDRTQHLLLAILARAVRDVRDAHPRIREEARRWLLDDPLCAEICEILGYNLPALHRAAGLRSPQRGDRVSSSSRRERPQVTAAR
jgi:hypothetical protein